jgi:hypothetical protein
MTLSMPHERSLTKEIIDINTALGEGSDQSSEGRCLLLPMSIKSLYGPLRLGM